LYDLVDKMSSQSSDSDVESNFSDDTDEADVMFEMGEGTNTIELFVR